MRDGLSGVEGVEEVGVVEVVTMITRWRFVLVWKFAMLKE